MEIDDPGDTTEPTSPIVGFAEVASAWLHGPDGVERLRAQRVRDEIADQRQADREQVEADDMAEHRRTIRRLAEREAQGRALQQQAAGWLIAVLGVELVTAVPLLAWGLWSGELWQ